MGSGRRSETLSGLGQWLWRTGAGVVDWASNGDNWKAAGQKAWTATPGARNTPRTRSSRPAMEAGLRGRPWPAAWDAGRVVWGAAQVAATGVEVVKLGGRITNATSYLLNKRA